MHAMARELAACQYSLCILPRHQIYVCCLAWYLWFWGSGSPFPQLYTRKKPEALPAGAGHFSSGSGQPTSPLTAHDLSSGVNFR